MPQEALMAVLDSHGIFLFPSLFEGYGKAPFEAMARGLCVVASNVGGMRDLIRDGGNGFLCEPGDAQGFANAIRRLCEDMALAQDLSREARETARCLTWENCARRCEAFYRELLSRNQATAMA